MFGLHASAGVVGSVASALVAPSAYCAAVVECVATAVFVGDDVVGFGAVGLHAVVVVEFGVADWAVGDASGLIGLEDSFAPASVFAGCGAAGLAGHVLILAWFVCCGWVGCLAWWVCCGGCSGLVCKICTYKYSVPRAPPWEGVLCQSFL